jgi:hypothetical protein
MGAGDGVIILSRRISSHLMSPHLITMISSSHLITMISSSHLIMTTSSSHQLASPRAQFAAFGAPMGLRAEVVVGGVDMTKQVTSALYDPFLRMLAPTWYSMTAPARPPLV